MRFVGMAGLGTPEAMQAFVDAYGLRFPQAVSVDGRLWAHFGIVAQPAWVFVDDAGETDVIPYELERRPLERILDELAAK